MDIAAKALRWTSSTDFALGDLRFTCVEGVYEERTDAEHVVLLKNRAMIERQLEIYRAAGVRHAFEFGIFQGGSSLLLTEALGLVRFAALDMSPPVEALDAIVVQQGLSDRIRLTYGVSQNSEDKVRQAIGASFEPGEIDLIIDDASHHYELTAASFEIAFPYLRAGGLYVIEDWGWAHWPGRWRDVDSPWRERRALSELVVQLAVAVASRPDHFARLELYPTFAVLQKGAHAPVGDQRYRLSAGQNLREGTQLHL